MGAPRATILLVDDELLVAQVLCDQLEMEGYAVLGPASNGEEALTLVRSRRPDLMVLDVGLRGAMGGVELARAVQAEADIPVIFLTGYAREDVARRTGDIRRARLLTKPILADRLYAEVRAALAGKPELP